MKAMVVKKCWFSSVLEQQEVKTPEIKNNEVLIKVCAVGVNRWDIMNVATSNDGVCPGLECCVIIDAIGRNVKYWKVGERVCAILEGGGYAEQVAVPGDFLLPLPDDIDLVDAVGLPYASCSIWLALFKMHDAETFKDKIILIREGTRGIGALAIHYAKYMGLKVIASTGSSDKFSICHRYGADFCVDHTSANFVCSVEEKLESLGVDFVLDYGASDLRRNLECCRFRGKIVIEDLHGNECNSIDLVMLMKTHARTKVFDLPSKDSGYKASVIAELRTHLWPAVLQKNIVRTIEVHFSMIEAPKALALLKKDDSVGKIILHINSLKSIRHLKMN